SPSFASTGDGPNSAYANAMGRRGSWRNLLDRIGLLAPMRIGGGRRAGQRAKGPGEMWLVVKPGLRRDVRQGESSGFHEDNRALNTEPQHELVRRHADGA